MSGLLSLEAALARMLDRLQPLPTTTVGVDDAVGRVLAEPIVAHVTMPRWDNSAMDGFAVQAADVTGATKRWPKTLRVAGESRAGHAPDAEVKGGTAVRILTGAMVPAGADAVVPVEDTDAPPGMADLPETVTVRAVAAAGANIRLAGSDLHQGDRLLEPGVRISPAAVAVIVAAGYGAVRVHRRPRVAVLATGDELVEAGAPLGPGQIHDSNAPAIAAQARQLGAEVRRLGIAGDSLGEVERRLGEATAWADVVVASGGVSVGAHDVVKTAFGRFGELDLWRVAIQPGKPLAFGRAVGPEGGHVLFFGLPGNPVSTFVTFELFVRPVLRRLSGDRDPLARDVVRARLASAMTKARDRRAFLRVVVEPDPETPGGWLAVSAGGQGSHVLSALAAANGLAIIPEDVDGLPAGAEVDVWRLEGA
ncbi:MAG TPA: gephyrin-like molybdotransferase Glp [Candidatus Limnocylindrales bacterium]